MSPHTRTSPLCEKNNRAIKTLVGFSVGLIRNKAKHDNESLLDCFFTPSPPSAFHSAASQGSDVGCKQAIALGKHSSSSRVNKNLNSVLDVWKFRVTYERLQQNLNLEGSRLQLLKGNVQF